MIKKVVARSFIVCLGMVLVLGGCGTTHPSSGGSGGKGGGLGGAQLDTSWIENQHVGLSYGTVSETQTLNLYLPQDGVKPYPIIVAIHGGAFKMGSATGGDVAAMLEGVNRGYAVASVNYRLSGEAVFPAAVSDVKAAIRFLKASADQYGLDAGRMAVWGDSAGGNLAAMVGTSAGVSKLIGDNRDYLSYDSSVRAVVDWFGPLDFLAMDAQFAKAGIEPAMGKTSRASSPESAYLGQLITDVPDLARQADPGTYIERLTQDSAPYFFIQHGSSDSHVPVQQSENFSKALEQKLGADYVTLSVLVGAGHGTDEFTSEENLDRVFSFIDSVLKQ